MKFYTITTLEVKALVNEKRTKGYRIIADEKHMKFKRIDALICELVACVGTPSIYRNMNHELTFDFDKED